MDKVKTVVLKGLQPSQDVDNEIFTKHMRIRLNKLIIKLGSAKGAEIALKAAKMQAMGDELGLVRLVRALDQSY